MNKKRYSIFGIILLLLMSLGFTGGEEVQAAEPVISDSYTDCYTYSSDLKYNNSLGEFTEDDILYYVVKKPEGGKEGEAAVELYSEYGDDKTYPMKEIKIPEKVKHSGKIYKVIAIDAGAFREHENLEKMTLPDSITYIGKCAFWGCTHLKQINIPKNVKEIGDGALGYTSALKTVTFSDSIKTLPYRVLSHSGVSKVTLPSKLNKIEASAFEHCYSLKSITLPKSLKECEGSVFYACVNLEKVENVSVLSDEAKKNAFNLTKWGIKNKLGTSAEERSDKDALIDFYMDGKRVTDGYLYYSATWYTAASYNLPVEEGELGAYYLCPINKDGYFVLDKEYITSYGEIIYGSFYYSAKKTDNFLENYDVCVSVSAAGNASAVANEIYSLEEKEAQRIREEEGEEAYYEFNNNRTTTWRYSDEHKDDPLRLEVYSVEFVQGDRECICLPEKTYYPRYGYANMPTAKARRTTNAEIWGSTVPVAAGQIFSHYEDEDGNKYTNRIDYITKPMKLHPVFIDISDYADTTRSLYPLLNYLWEKDHWGTRAEDVVVKTKEQLLNRLQPGDYNVTKEGICIIDGNITLTKEDVDNYLKDNGKEASSLFSFGDYIIIRNGKLTLDGVNIYAQSSICIDVSAGATLKVINDTKLPCDLRVDKGGKVIINDSTIDGNVTNAGTIDVEIPDYRMSSDAYGRTSLACDALANLTTGVINLKYGKLTASSGHTWDFDAPGITKDDIFTEEDAQAVNYGTINVSDMGWLSFNFSQADHHKDAYKTLPFLNEGTINIVQTQTSHTLFSALVVRNARMVNNGKISIKSSARLVNFDDCYGLRGIDNLLYANFVICEGEVINNGKLDITSNAGLGLSIEGSFFFYKDHQNYNFGDDNDYAYFSRLTNSKSGEITLTSNGGTAAAIGSYGCIINDGKITLKDKDVSSDEASLIIGGRVVNNGTLTNNGTIGYYADGVRKFSGFDKQYGIIGKKVKGKGTELLAYKVNLSNVGSYGDGCDIFISGDKRTLVCGESANVLTDSAWVLLPANKTVKLTAKYTGYSDATKSFKTAASGKAYMNAAISACKSGKQYNNTISISMKKGTSTVSKSVTKKNPVVQGTCFFSKTKGQENDYYQVITDDGKTRTVWFEYNISSMQKTIEVPDTVKYNGRTFKVVWVGGFSGNDDCTKVVIGSNVEYIGANAFAHYYRDSKIKNIIIKTTKLKEGSLGTDALAGVPDGCKITVPKSCLKKYKELFKKAGLSSKVKVVAK